MGDALRNKTEEEFRYDMPLNRFKKISKIVFPNFKYFPLFTLFVQLFFSL